MLSIIKFEAADNFPVRPYINCSQYWMNITKCFHSAFAMKAELAPSLFKKSKYKQTWLILDLFISSRGYTAFVNGVNANHSHPKGLGLETRGQHSFAPKKGRSHRFLLSCFDNETMGGHTFSGRLEIWKKLLLFTQCILQLWLFLAILLLRDAVNPKISNTYEIATTDQRKPLE